MERTAEIVHAALPTTSADQVFRSACREVSAYTGANRVSIWCFNEDNASIRCDCYYEFETDSFSEGTVLRADDHPVYFAAIQEQQVIIAPDARTNPITAEFVDTYFRDNDILSLLDFILHRDFQPAGIICCENAGRPRAWRDEDVAYLRQMATLISFFFKRD